MKMKSFLNSNTVRGLRNNNPGNLRITPIDWEGKIPNSENSDGAFEQFYYVRWGLRALMRDIINDINKGLNTVEMLISAYAPASDNNHTQAYINFVSDVTGFSPMQVLTANKTTVIALAKSIVEMEIGPPYKSELTDADYLDAWNIRNATFNKADIVETAKKVCKYCGHVIIGVGLFFFTIFSLNL